MVGSMCAGSTLIRSPTCSGEPGTNVRCSSEQNHTSDPSTDGLPWSMPSAFTPQSATAQPFDTEITVASTDSAWTKGSPSFAYAVSMRTYDPAWISVAHVLMS